MSATPDRRDLIAVTGANGLIGQILCTGLAGDFELRPVIRSERLPHGMVARLDDPAALCRAFEGCASVVHLAAAATVTAPWDEVLDANIVGTANVFAAALNARVRRVVFASSNHVVGGYEVEGAPEVYELDAQQTIDENNEVRPDSLYGVSKIFGEALGRYYHDTFGMAVICLRIGSVRADDHPYGPSVHDSAGWLDLDDQQRLARSRATWMSHRDCVELFRCALTCVAEWSVCFGTSANPRLMWSLARARRQIGYVPLDGADPLLPAAASK